MEKQRNQVYPLIELLVNDVFYKLGDKKKLAHIVTESVYDDYFKKVIVVRYMKMSEKYSFKKVATGHECRKPEEMQVVFLRHNSIN